MRAKSAEAPHLLARAASGERAAQRDVDALVGRFARKLAGVGTNSLGGELDWEDVAQETSRRLYAGAIHRFRGKSPEGYLHTMVRSTMLMMARTAQRRGRREEAVAPAEEARPADTLRLEVDSILGRIDAGCRRLLTAVFLEDLPYSTLAREEGLAESSLRAKVSRCLKRTRERLA